MNMIEKVANAIKAVALEAKSKGYAGTDRAWEEMAKAAIEAMREPTDEMCEHAYDNWFNELFEADTWTKERGTFRAMIDAALNDQ